MTILCLSGDAIRLEFRRDLRARRGKIDARGTEVHAATFLRRRLMVLDEALERDRDELDRIFVHEIFHFTWTRLGNARRLEFEELLGAEMDARARGELGWSAESRKRLLTAADRKARGRKWREYCCESFCDSAAYVVGGREAHGEFTLAARHRERRRAWFRMRILNAAIPV